MYRVLVTRDIDSENKTTGYFVAILESEKENEAEGGEFALAFFDKDRVLYDISVDQPIPNVDLANLVEGYFRLWTTTWHLLFWQIKDKWEEDGVYHEDYMMTEITDLETNLRNLSDLYPPNRPPKTKDEKIRELVNYYNGQEGAIPIDPDQKYRDIVFSFWARGIRVSSYLTYGRPYDDVFEFYSKYIDTKGNHIAILDFNKLVTPALFMAPKQDMKYFLQNSLNMRETIASTVVLAEAWKVFNDKYWLKLSLSEGKRIITYKQFRTVLEKKQWKKRDLVYVILVASGLDLYLDKEEIIKIIPPNNYVRIIFFGKNTVINTR